MKVTNIDMLSQISRAVKSKAEPIEQELGLITPIINTQEIDFSLHSSTTVTATGLTIILPAGKEFYLKSIKISLVKDATCDVADGSLLVTCNSIFAPSTSTYLFFEPFLTLTAERINLIEVFDIPMRLVNGSTISLSSQNFTVGRLRKSIIVRGYTREI